MSTFIPLRKIDVRANILDGIAKVVLTCNFENAQQFSVNPIHYFSLDCNATINKLSMQIGDRMLTSVTKEKSTARKEYVAAVSDGKKASLIEKLSDNDYKLSVGNVNQHEMVNINIEYVTTLDCNQNGSYIFVFPTNISVKYFSSRNASHEDKIYSREMDNMIYRNDIQYNYTFGIIWTSANKILGVEAPVDVCNIEYTDDKVCIASIGNPSNGDFVIAVKTEHKPCVYYYKDDITRDIYTLTTIRVDKPTEIMDDRLKKDFRIIVDCSGSMDSKFGNSTKMRVTVEAVIKFLNMLNQDDYFNITFFGSTFIKFSQSSVKATRESVYFAVQRMSQIIANLGGTELFDCLNDSIIDTDNFDDAQCEKIIVIFTDGQIGNYNGLMSEIESNYNFCNDFSSAMASGDALINNRFRIFTVGMGDDVDRKLIKKMADITGGLYVYAKDSFRMESTLEYIINNINARYYLNARLGDDIDQSKMHSAMYPNKNYVFIRKFSQTQIRNLEENGITLLCTNSKTNALVRCNVKFSKFVKKSIELKQLYTNLVIKKLEHDVEFGELSYTEHHDYIKNITELSINHNIMSKYTSFLIVDDNKTTFEPSIDVTIPHYSNNHASLVSSNNCGPRMEEVDALDGGMDMFGGGGGGGYSSAYSTGEKDFVPYETEINKNNIIHSLNHLNQHKMFYLEYKFACYKSVDDIVKYATRLKMSPELYYNIIMYFAMIKHKDLQDHAYQLLCAICKSETTLTAFKMLKTKNLHKENIYELNAENNRRQYRYYPERSWGGGGDY